MLAACYGEPPGQERSRGSAPQDPRIREAPRPHGARRRPGGRQPGDGARGVPLPPGTASAGRSRPAGGPLARGDSRRARAGAGRLILVVDASAAVEYLLLTPLGERVGDLLGGAALAAPELLDAEVLAVLRREVLAGRLRERRATEAVDDLRAWGVERLAHRLLLEDAWSLRGHITAYDALYVAAARARHAALVTADGPLARAAALGVVVHNVRPGRPPPRPPAPHRPPPGRDGGRHSAGGVMRPEPTARSASDFGRRSLRAGKPRRGPAVAATSGSPSPRLSHGEHPRPVGAEVCGLRGGAEAARRLVGRLIGQVERPPVHGDRMPRPEVERGAHRLLGIEVHEAHDRARLVGADRERGDVDLPEPLAERTEAVEVAGVAGVVEAARGPLDDPSRPQAPSVPDDGASREVLRGYAVHPDGAHLHALSPVELDHLAAGGADEVAHLEAGDKTRTMSGQRLDGRQIGVVVVVVRQRHEVDRRQRVERDTRRDQPLRPGERHRARALGEDRVGQERDAVHADEKRRVADPREARVLEHGGAIVGHPRRGAVPPDEW